MCKSTGYLNISLNVNGYGYHSLSTVILDVFPHYIRYVLNPPENVQFQILKKDPTLIKCMPNTTQKAQMMVINKDPELYKTIPNPHPKVKKFAKTNIGDPSYNSNINLLEIEKSRKWNKLWDVHDTTDETLLFIYNNLNKINNETLLNHLKAILILHKKRLLLLL